MNTLFDQIWENKLSFLGTFFIVFTLTYLVLMAADFLPEAPDETDSTPTNSESAQATNSDDSDLEDETLESSDNTAVNEEAMTTEADLPVEINIKRLDKTITVLNPESRNIADLDAALLEGVVRHPDSAALNQLGNVFILGHSSYLPRVFNKNFQAFNGIQNLKWGDIIEVRSENAVYEYRVDKVYEAKAQDLTVPIAGEEHKLTLATCDSFGSVDDRYIVEASRISVGQL